MRHGNSNKKFGRKRKVRKALFNSLALNLIVREKIKTTEPKAKALRPFIEKLVTLAKKNNTAARKIVISRLSNREREVKKLFDVIAPKYKDRNGGYTRIMKLGVRKADSAPMATIEFV